MSSFFGDVPEMGFRFSPLFGRSFTGDSASLSGNLALGDDDLLEPTLPQSRSSSPGSSKSLEETVQFLTQRAQSKEKEGTKETAPEIADSPDESGILNKAIITKDSIAAASLPSHPNEGGGHIVARFTVVVKPRGVETPPQFANAPHFASVDLDPNTIVVNVGQDGAPIYHKDSESHASRRKQSRPSSRNERRRFSSSSAYNDQISDTKSIDNQTMKKNRSSISTRGYKNPNVRHLRQSAPRFCAALSAARRVYPLHVERVACRMDGCGALLLHRGSSMLQHVYKHAPERLFQCPLFAPGECGHKGSSFSFMIIDHIRKEHPRLDPYKFVDLRPRYDELLAETTRKCYG